MLMLMLLPSLEVKGPTLHGISALVLASVPVPPLPPPPIAPPPSGAALVLLFLWKKFVIEPRKRIVCMCCYNTP
jgi:hypothetical protein